MNDQFGSTGAKHVSIKEAASRVGYTTDYVARLARAGKIDSVKDGSRRLIDLEGLKLFELSARAEKQRRQEALRTERLREQQLAQSKEKGSPTMDTVIPSALPTLLRSLAFFFMLMAGTVGFMYSHDELQLAVRTTYEQQALAEVGEQSALVYVAFADAANARVIRSMDDLVARVTDAHIGVRNYGRQLQYAYEAALAEIGAQLLAAVYSAVEHSLTEANELEVGFNASAERVVLAVQEVSGVLSEDDAQTASLGNFTGNELKLCAKTGAQELRFCILYNFYLSTKEVLYGKK